MRTLLPLIVFLMLSCSKERIQPNCERVYQYTDQYSWPDSIYRHTDVWSDVLCGKRLDSFRTVKDFWTARSCDTPFVFEHYRYSIGDSVTYPVIFKK